MNDDMIRRLAEKGGVIQITFGSIFVNTELNRRYVEDAKHINDHVAAHGLDSEQRDAYAKEYFETHPLGQADVTDVAAHIDHAVQLVGVDHVGLGSDFDGVSSLPQGLTDVSCYPNLIQELLKKGYSEDDIAKICGANFLRVWTAIQETARNLQSDN
jgi:membrane dipeptidase